MSRVVVPAVATDHEVINQITEIAWWDTYPNEEFGITLDDIKLATAAFRANSRPDRFQELVTDPTRKLLVAKVDDKIVGFIYARKDQSPYQIQSLYILPEYQGQGIGGDLMRSALEWLGQENEIALGVATYNKKAIGFYGHFGFKENGIREDSSALLPNGKRIPEIEMVIQNPKNYIDKWPE